MRKKILSIIFLTLTFIIIAGCSNDSGTAEGSSTGSNTTERTSMSGSNTPAGSSTSGYDSEDIITAEDVLKMDRNADIFQFDGIVYQTDIDWIDELTLTKDEHVGEITEINTSTTNFKNGMANKLPVGSKIYTAKERRDVLLVETEDGEILKYYEIVEG